MENELALLEEGRIIYVSVAPSCPKGELHRTTALRGAPQCRLENEVRAVLPKTSLEKDHAFIFFFFNFQSVMDEYFLLKFIKMNYF